MCLIDDQDPAPAFDVGLDEGIGKVEPRGGGATHADQAQGVRDRPVEVGGGIRGREVDVHPGP